MTDDGTLINNYAFMARVFADIKELKDYNFLPDHKFYIGDMVKIDGRIHMWDGQKWADEDTIYVAQETHK